MYIYIYICLYHNLVHAPDRRQIWGTAVKIVNTNRSLQIGLPGRQNLSWVCRSILPQREFVLTHVILTPRREKNPGPNRHGLSLP